MIQFTERFITPEVAKEMLLGNDSNRKLKQRVVDRYAKDIVAGRWRTNTGEVIKISKTGRILDGQHRLYAIIKSEKGINIHIATGLENDTFDVIDTGINRLATDVFYIGQIPNSTILPGLIQAYSRIKTKTIKINETGLTNTQVLDIYNSDPEEWQLIMRKTHVLYTQFSKILPKSIIGSLLKAFKEASDEATAMKFLTQLCLGKDYDNDVVVWLRKKFYDDKISHTKLPLHVKYELIIRAWNTCRKNKNVTRLKVIGEIDPII